MLSATELESLNPSMADLRDMLRVREENSCS